MSGAMDAEPSPVPVAVMDVEYSGRFKVARLLAVATHSLPGSSTELDALRLAADAAKQGIDTGVYLQVTERIAGRLGAEYATDGDWVDETNRKAAQTLERLDTEFHRNKGSLPKEAVRVGYHDLGDFLYERGNLSGAFKAYVRSRDYCTTTAQVVDMCLAVIRTSLELPTFTIHIPNFVQKAESALDAGPGGEQAASSAQSPSPAVVTSKLRVASALALLTDKKYASVARRLGEVAPDLGVAELGDLGFAPGDVATLGALCALASLDRPGLRAVVVDNVSFRTYLDACPDIRDLVLHFHGARYGACLAAVDKLRGGWKLDMHLREHVDTLCDDIRSKALAAYVAPYSRMRLSDMATALQLPPHDVTAQLAGLIQEGVVAARIDRGAGVVHATRSDARTQAFTTTMAAATAYIRDTKALLLRASLMQNDVAFPGAGQRGGHRGVAGREDDGFDGGTFSPVKTAHGRFDDRSWYGRDRPRARGGARAELAERRD